MPLSSWYHIMCMCFAGTRYL